MKKLNVTPMESRLRYAQGELLDCFQGVYGNGQIALLLKDAADGTPVAKATVAVEEKIPQGCIVVKDYSETEGMSDTLIRAGLIDPEVVMTVSCGHVSACVYRLKEVGV
jgi:hypothetical protein